MSTVLLVDDEPGVLFTLSELLVERGHRVLSARSGGDALGKLDEADAVLTDLSMPGMDARGLNDVALSEDAGMKLVARKCRYSIRAGIWPASSTAGGRRFSLLVAPCSLLRPGSLPGRVFRVSDGMRRAGRPRAAACHRPARLGPGSRLARRRGPPSPRASCGTPRRP